MPESKLSREAFDAQVERSGLPLDEAMKAEIYTACGYLEQMKARVRVGGERPDDSESTHVLRPRE
jgi:hypothetical protein